MVCVVAMYEVIFNNKFTNVLVFYVYLLVLFLVSPFLFVWELVNSVSSCLRCKENMSGKVVLITGASSGLGEFMAYEYAKRGAYLSIIATQKPNSQLKQVADRARELGSPDVLCMFADVSKVDECMMFVDDTIQHFGRLDHLVCNAGIGSLYSINNDVTKFTSVLDINFWGSVYPTHFAIPHLMKTNGKIIINASAAGVLNPPGGGFYNASKVALISFYETLRFEVSPTITITILTLGFIQTNLITAKYSSDGVGARLRKDLRDVVPTMEVEPCAKAIVDGISKGATSITEPRFFKVLMLIKFLFPQLHHFYYNTYSAIVES
ncbi:11-beta-hydroxysteroid dehydrogenase 1A-like [Bidens hawaiensis]|uniref:11-beta-hydroxysteroid dehydrogenase 1A-like n=1 Tax=Bidens hawaiensis TaxID=980011 RepID=UPI00404A863A